MRLPFFHKLNSIFSVLVLPALAFLLASLFGAIGIASQGIVTGSIAGTVLDTYKSLDIVNDLWYKLL